jgi:quinol monooxygenase YgiN
LHADASNADVLWVYELYENQEAATAHMTADWFAPFGQSLAPLMGGRPEMFFLTPIQGKGL